MGPQGQGALMTTTADLTLAREGSLAFNGYLARPEGGSGPGVVVLTDMFGLNAPIRAVADRCARRGFPALVPNLFWRAQHPGEIPYDDAEHARAWERLKAFDLNIGTRDIAAAVDWLRGQAFCTGKVAAIGFCGGGRWAYLAAARTSIDGAAALYGLGISQHLGELSNVKCPLQLHYGLQDQHVPRQEIDTVAAGVKGHRLVEVLLYPHAGHSFANPVRPTYDVAATTLAWSRIDAMLDGLR
jgi:carboxymethylenebutenolidase